MNKPADIDQYLASVPDAARATLETIRATIKSLVPDAVEVLAYGMPGYRYRGRPLVYYGAAKNHCALYGLVPDELKGDLAGYDTSKGTIRFPVDQPPPEALLRRLLNLRIGAIDAAEDERRQKRRKTSV